MKKQLALTIFFMEVFSLVKQWRNPIFFAIIKKQLSQQGVTHGRAIQTYDQ
jgi:hypothetical protein